MMHFILACLIGFFSAFTVLDISNVMAKSSKSKKEKTDCDCEDHDDDCDH